MKRTVSIVLFSVCCIVFLQAQNSEKAVRKIRTEYNSIKSEIAKLQKEEYTGAFYCLRLTDNVYNKSYPGVGGYILNRYFYYEQKDTQDDLQWQPYLVTESAKAAENITYCEYMYMDNKLVFAYHKSKYDDNVEKRIYLQNGKVIRYTENNKETALEGDKTLFVDYMRAFADNIQQQFMSIKKQ